MMIYYIISAIIITTVLLVKFTDFVHLSHKSFRKYFKFILFSLILILIFYLMRFFPAIISSIPVFFLILYRWGPLISFFSKLFFKKTSSKSSYHQKMTKKEALEILGLKKNASRKEILDSYQNLMKKNHPDLGGSDWITKKINKARETLLG